MPSPAQHSAVLCVITPGERQTLHTSHSHNQVILQTGPVYLCVTLRWWERSRGSYCSDWTVQPENIDSLISSASYNLISLISIMQRFMSLVMDVLTVRPISYTWNVLNFYLYIGKVDLFRNCDVSFFICWLLDFKPA